MDGMRVGSATAALVILAFGAAAATADLCTSAKLKAIGKKESGLLGCQSKLAAKNDASGLVACEAKVSGKFSVAFARAGACIGDQATCENIGDGCETDVAAAMTDALPSKCEATKRRAAGKLARAELSCYAKAAATGSPLDATCIARATGKFAAAITRAGTCPDGGLPQTLVENSCVKPAVATDGGGTVIDVCPMTTTTTNTTSSTSTSSSSTTTSTSSSTTSSTSSSSTTTSTSSSTTSSTSSSSSSSSSTSSTSSTTSTSSSTSTSATTSTTSTTLDCSFLTGWGSPGTGDGQFNLPRGVAVDGSGNVYVADESNNRLQKFDGTGTFLTKWGIPGTGDGQFDLPIGVAVDGSGNVYVTDSNNGRIQMFDGTGSFLTQWGSLGTGDGQFANPSGVAVDGGGNVYVAEAGNDRIQKFTSSGTFLAKWGSSGSGDGEFHTPIGIAVDGGGNVYVAEAGNDRIQQFTSGGAFVAKWGSSGSGDGQFATPTGVAVDGSGNIYVADTINTRIQKFTCATLPPTSTSTTSTSSSTNTSTSTTTTSTTSTSTSTSSTTNTSATSTTTTSTTSTTTTSTSTSSTTTTTVPGCFQDLGDGTIRDTCTGLQWEKKDTVVGSGVNAADLHDVDNRYSWAGLCTVNTTVRCQPNAAAATTCAAQTGGAVGCGECGVADGTCNVDPFALGAITTVWDWINAVNAANFAGHGDWRLPSENGRNTSPSTDPRELETILLAPDPCGTSPCIASIFGPTVASYYWSATTFAPLPGYAFAVNFLNGTVNGDGKFFDDSVRAVRTGS